MINQPEHPPPNILYIAGYGRSGSTLLNVLMGQLPGAVAVGEFKRIFSSYEENRRCACGQPLQDCAFWQPIMTRFQERMPDVSLTEADRISTQIEGMANVGLRRQRDPALQDRYHHIWQTMTTLVAEEAGASLIVDASKSVTNAANRTLSLSQLAGLNVKVLHLVRDPRAVMASTVRQNKTRAERKTQRHNPLRAQQTLIGWLGVNLYLHRILDRENAALIRYEDLTNEPILTLKRIGVKLNLDVEPLIRSIETREPIAADHVFSGSSVRLGGETTIRPARDSWRQSLPTIARWSAAAGYPLARHYGYMKASS